MSFFDKLKETADKASKTVANKYQDHKEKVDELNETRGPRLGATAVEYVGGYENYTKTNGALVFYQNQTELTSVLQTVFVINNNGISDIVIEGKDEVNRRVTVTRLLTVGIFAFALKKKSKDKEAFLTIVLNDGQEAIFHIRNKSPMELRSQLAKAISQVKVLGKTSPSHPTSNLKNNVSNDNVADELLKLSKLKDQGILTQEEFDTKKRQMLGL